MAYVNHPSSWGAEESSEVVFSEYETPNARNSYALCEVCADKRWHCVHSCLPSNIAPLSLVCQVRFDHQICISSTKLIFFSNLLQNVNFTNPFYKPPVVLTTVLNGRNNPVNLGSQAKGPLVSWLEVYQLIVHFRNCYGCRGYAKKLKLTLQREEHCILSLISFIFIIDKWNWMTPPAIHLFVCPSIISFPLHLCMHTSMRACLNAYIHSCIHTHVCMNVWMCACIRAWMYACIQACIAYMHEAYMNAYMHPCIHMHPSTCQSSSIRYGGMYMLLIYHFHTIYNARCIFRLGVKESVNHSIRLVTDVSRLLTIIFIPLDPWPSFHLIY